MKIENLLYTDETKTVIKADIRGETCFVPVDKGNADYNDIQKAIEAKEVPDIIPVTEPFKE